MTRVLAPALLGLAARSTYLEPVSEPGHLGLRVSDDFACDDHVVALLHIERSGFPDEGWLLGVPADRIATIRLSNRLSFTVR